MSDLFCNAVDVKNSTGVKNNNDNHSTSNPNSELLNNITFGNYNDDNFIRSQSGVKKPRLSEKLISLATPTNGFKDAYGTYGPDSLPEIHEETKEIRLCFNSELKQALEDKLTKYLTFIQAIEKKTDNLKEEVSQLKCRMDFMESSAKDLMKLIDERIPLPTPTDGVGQQRSLSSQAPRLPLPHLAVSTPDRSLQTVNPLNLQSTLSSNTPPAANQPSDSASSKLFSIDAKSSSELACLPQPTHATILTIQVNDTIDLTSDTSVENAFGERLISGSANTSDVMVYPRKSRKQNMQSLTCLSNPKNGIISTVHAQPSVTFATNVSNPNQTYFDLSQAGQIVPVSQVVNSSQVYSLPLSVIPDVHLLPTALLPPVPPQPATNTHQLPLQPVPQLTIAEAAEGVCLQWSVTYPSGAFEPAVAYEIYSYASSEVTLVSLQTCLPWKKVGEVTALPLPMACTLTHVEANNMYYFTVRSVDRLLRYSSWSNIVNAYVS